MTKNLVKRSGFERKNHSPSAQSHICPYKYSKCFPWWWWIFGHYRLQQVIRYSKVFSNWPRFNTILSILNTLTLIPVKIQLPNYQMNQVLYTTTFFNLLYLGNFKILTVNVKFQKLILASLFIRIHYSIWSSRIQLIWSGKDLVKNEQKHFQLILNIAF